MPKSRKKKMPMKEVYDILFGKTDEEAEEIFRIRMTPPQDDDWLKGENGSMDGRDKESATGQ